MILLKKIKLNIKKILNIEIIYITTVLILKQHVDNYTAVVITIRKETNHYVKKITKIRQ